MHMTYVGNVHLIYNCVYLGMGCIFKLSINDYPIVNSLLKFTKVIMCIVMTMLLFVYNFRVCPRTEMDF